MTAHAHHQAENKLDIGQLIKWTVYILLLFNWGFYFWEEWVISGHTLRQGGTFLEWTEAFATSIDELGWFGLLLAFELETYVLDDDAFDRPKVKWSVYGLRMVCYLLIAHTILARTTTVMDVEVVTLSNEYTNVCQLVGKDMSWGDNFYYDEITQENCAGFTEDERLYFIEPMVITDHQGFATEKKMTWLDLFEAITWLLIMFTLEVAVWLQNREITGGTLMLLSHLGKLLYGFLFFAAGYWVYRTHWVYAWDELLWIVGFWAIERNLSEWRDEIREDQDTDPDPEGAVAPG